MTWFKVYVATYYLDIEIDLIFKNHAKKIIKIKMFCKELKMYDIYDLRF